MTLAIAVRLILQSTMSSTVKAVIRMYRRGEEKPIERHKARISVTEDSTKQGIDSFEKHLADFLGLKEQASKLGLGSFDPKLYRLVKGNSKTENYSILTRVPAAQRPAVQARDDPAARWPSPDFLQSFCPAVNPRACTDLHLVWACKFEFGYDFNNHLIPFRSFLSVLCVVK